MSGNKEPKSSAAKIHTGRYVSLPSLHIKKKSTVINRLIIEEDLRFLHENGFISPKYLKKSPKNGNHRKPASVHQDILKLDDENNESISNEPELLKKFVGSSNLYNEYKEYVKPSHQDLNYLCPSKELKTPKPYRSPIPSNIPKSTYMAYKQESMAFLKDTNYRIKRAKEYLKIAKNLATRY